MIYPGRLGRNKKPENMAGQQKKEGEERGQVEKVEERALDEPGKFCIMNTLPQQHLFVVHQIR